MDGPQKEGKDENNNMCLIKQKGKVKALDEELCSKSASDPSHRLHWPSAA